MIHNLNFFQLEDNDIDEIVSAFKAIGWNKSRIIYENYLQEQSNNDRSVIIAKVNGRFCGYVTIKWKCHYDSFAKEKIIELVKWLYEQKS